MPPNFSDVLFMKIYVNNFSFNSKIIYNYLINSLRQGIYKYILHLNKLVFNVQS